ncbi:hypothetical protein MPTK1_1g08930 [Marchantia polymorpha subsp. ruderalis]|uniref:Uncharacterized protein n=2 Tax=Marchantia polymorpha TaxID=3197 RepID=A0AAF6AN40_MARPO|nr:hypothetical protein MARPO_0036s0133 [Marchantia polymorpha]BBM97860.1 hypothetical protein Mp_1g08930 [Marchantia polymorpha subsp. ruderalis]|eukprot:PTQ41161.1 hypothetical protein MARPO_0036s0133 [Marchantia polymorpha]
MTYGQMIRAQGREGNGSSDRGSEMSAQAQTRIKPRGAKAPLDQQQQQQEQLSEQAFHRFPRAAVRTGIGIYSSPASGARPALRSKIIDELGRDRGSCPWWLSDRWRLVLMVMVLVVGPDDEQEDTQVLQRTLGGRQAGRQARQPARMMRRTQLLGGNLQLEQEERWLCWLMK